MAISLDIKANLKLISNNIKKVVQDALKSARGAPSGAEKAKEKTGEKSVGLLSTIVKRLGILAILASFRPILDVVSFLLNLGMFGLLKILGFIKDVPSELVNIKDKLKEALKTLLEQLLIGLFTLGSFLFDAFLNVIGRVIEILKPLPGKFFEIIKKLAPLIGEFIIGLLKGLVILFKTLWARVKEVWEILKPVFIAVSLAIQRKLLDLKDKLKAKVDELKKDFKAFFSDKFNDFRRWIVSDGPRVIVNAIIALPRAIASALLNFFRSPGKSVGDAIIKPDGTIIQTDPGDTLIATKNPEGLGGGGNVFNFFGVTQEEFLEKAKRELAIDQFRSGRF